jgi:phasin family protein
MNVKPQELFSASLGTASFFANAAIDGIERLAALNLSAGRSFVEASFSNVQALLGATDVQSFVKLQKDLAAPTLEQGMAYGRNVIAIATETKDKIAKEVESKVAEANVQVSQLVEKALASAPAGSEVAVAAVKTAMKTANETYEGINKAVKQVAEATEASVSAATEATLKAANLAPVKAAPKAKKAA